MSMSRYDLGDKTPSHALEGAVLLYISTAKYGTDWHSIPHSHGFAEMFYVVGGAGSFWVEGESVPVSEGDLVIVDRDTEHTETSLASNPMEYIALGIDGYQLPASEEGRPWRVIHFLGRHGGIYNSLRGMLRETQEQQAGFEQVCQNFLMVTLVRIARHIGFPNAEPRKKTASRESTAARRYIDNHYRENITLDTLADAVHISKFHLAHVFSREYGVSPISYMQQLRLQECRELLTTTDYSVAQVARMTGFSSPSYFSQRFRAAEGMSPVQYRQQFTKK